MDELIEVKESSIHSTGVFAARDIKKGTKVIEYLGRLVSKEESEEIGDRDREMNQKDGTKGAVYLFELNDDFDLDGNVDWNKARFINHSCDPNCETENDGTHIWIVAMRKIKKGEEITYNYGYDTEDFEDHPCRCGKPNCIGYIVDEEHWPKVREHIAKRSRKP